MDKEILEGNKILFRFMEGKWQPAENIQAASITTYEGDYSTEEECKKECDIINSTKSGSLRNKHLAIPVPKIGGFKRELKYHSSWDWQIPVWVKVCSESLKKSMTKESADRHNKLYDLYSQCVAAGNVMQAFKYLVEGVKYINSNQPQGGK